VNIVNNVNLINIFPKIKKSEKSSEIKIFFFHIKEEIIGNYSQTQIHKIKTYEL
jgi:hypothetical protein